MRKRSPKPAKGNLKWAKGCQKGAKRVPKGPKGNQKECLQAFLQRERIPKQMPKKNPKGKQGFSTFPSRRSAARESKTKRGPRISDFPNGAERRTAQIYCARPFEMTLHSEWNSLNGG